MYSFIAIACSVAAVLADFVLFLELNDCFLLLFSHSTVKCIFDTFNDMFVSLAG
eukprot:m.46988 g.46988  ORF g.46988 m.46988 type:complete len:54 (+) comp10740_c0_seq1:22-183(+)